MDRLEALRDLAALLRESLESPSLADKRAALAGQYRATLAEIAALDQSEKAGDPVDELSARRAARGGATARQRRAAADQG